jgi:hypothetical protein
MISLTQGDEALAERPAHVSCAENPDVHLAAPSRSLSSTRI